MKFLTTSKTWELGLWVWITPNPYYCYGTISYYLSNGTLIKSSTLEGPTGESATFVHWRPSNGTYRVYTTYSGDSNCNAYNTSVGTPNGVFTWNSSIPQMYTWAGGLWTMTPAYSWYSVGSY